VQLDSGRAPREAASRQERLGGLTGRVPEWLLFARLALTALSFVIALGLEAPGDELGESARRGLFATVALAFGATAISGTLVRSVQKIHLFGAVQIGIDVAIATSLVHFSGGRESVFVFLYVLVTVYAALLFERWGAFGAATGSAVCYGAVILYATGHWPGELERGAPAPLVALGAAWAVHVGALYLVGALASLLARDLHRAGEALDRSADDLFRLRSLHERTVESIMSGLLTTDLSGRVKSFNRQAEHITGILVGMAVDRDVESLLPGVSRVMNRDLQRTGHEPARSRMPYRNERGEELHLGLTGSILRDADGKEVGHVVIFQDVTSVVAMEAQLRRSERLAAVGEMSAKMAHEIRNPLAAISGAVQVLRKNVPPEESTSEPRRLMDIVVREADRLSDLIQDFLHYARPRPPQLEPTDLGALARDVLELFESARPESVSLAVDACEVIAVVDRGQIEQVLWNLFLNAVQAMPEGGELRVTVTERGPSQGWQSVGRNEVEGRVGEQPGSQRWAEICVADTGIGIAAEIQELMFEPFFTTKKEGSGLGLSTVHRIVESHGGELRVSSSQGRGTRFWVQLPLPESTR
jgi:two-component system sensor histidine kinase PilS (NtrC family)